MPPTPRKRTNPSRGRGASAPAAPWTVWGAGLAGAALGLWLTSDGLWARLFGAYAFPAGWHSIWKMWPAVQAAGPAAMGWPLVVAGASWSGGLVGLSLGRRWAQSACLVLAVAALPFVGLGTILAAGSLGLLLHPSTRGWIRGRGTHG